MRKLSMLIMLVLLILQGAKAQNKKGDQNLGLSLNFYTGNRTDFYQTANAPGFQLQHSTSTGFTATPNYSYFIGNKLDIGVSLGYGLSTGTYSDRGNNTSSTQQYKNYFSSVYLRKYYLYNNRIGIRTGPFIDYQFSNSSVVNTPDTGNPNSTVKSLQAGINADFVYYPSAKVGLAVNLGGMYYSNNKFNYSQQSSNSKGVVLQFLNTNLLFSAFYVFGK